MERISPLEYYMTSITLRAVSVRRVRAVRRLLQRHGLKFSESRLSEELLRLYLRHWRGIGKKPATLRRYNIDGKDYQIRPLYIRDAYFISYEGETLENRGLTLSWMSKAHLIPKKGLHADEILARMRDSA